MREWTVGELLIELNKASRDALVRISDADTGWTIPMFTVSYHVKDNELWIFPCDYGDMTNSISK